jgi:hypothetical protein
MTNEGAYLILVETMPLFTEVLLVYENLLQCIPKLTARYLLAQPGRAREELSDQRAARQCQHQLHKDDHSPLTSAKVKNMWIYIYASTPTYIFMV